MSYNTQGYYEQDKVCYSEQEGYGRTGYGMPHHHNQHMGAAGWTDKVTECESYNAGRVGGGYNHGGYAPTLANQGYGCYERKEDMYMAQNGGHRMRGTGFHRRRVMRHSVNRGEYSSSESDSD